MSGVIALMNLPDDQRLHVQLSMYFYASTLAKLRNDVLANRAGWAVFEIAAPINAPVVQIAMDRRSTYVHGFRRAGATEWWAFQEPGRPLPALPGGARPMGLTGSYTELGLPAAINLRPERLLSLLAYYPGRPDPEFCQGIVLLLFLVAEALRFDSVLMECVRYFGLGTSSAYTIHPAEFRAVVNNWAAAAPGSRDVLVPYLG